MKSVSKRILVIPEGWCEYNYAQSLKQSLPRDKQRSISIEMPRPTSENSALQLLEMAKRMIKKAISEKNPFDAVWIFLDNDGQPNLETFYHKVNTASILMAYSSICIEHWFLLHFEENRMAFQNARQAYVKLESSWQNFFKQPYHKTKIAHFELLKDKMPIAMERVNRIKIQAQADEIPFAHRNPFFTVDEFILFFKSL